MRYAIAGLSMLLGSLSVATPVMAQVSVSVSIPGVSIGIHQPAYPDLVLVPGSPVYYAPQVPANYFFYDGLYWVFQDDNWYVSSWYNGPWDLVEPDDVPLFVLRVPVQYYLRPPVFFHTWIVTAPPRWHFYWGPRWTRYHHGWDHWDRHAIPAPAPLPVYQRYYHGDRYPRREYQRVIRHEHYHYQSRDQIVRRHDQQRAAPRPQVHAQPHNRPAQQGPAPHYSSQYSPDSSRQEQRPQRDREGAQRSQRTREEAQRSQKAREDRQRSEPWQLMTQQRPQQRATPAQAPVQPAQARADVPRQQPQREQRERGDSRKPEGMYVLPQQRAAVLQERQQQQQQRQQQQRQETPRAQQAPWPQRAQGQQGRERGGAEQRQGPRPDRGQEHGRDRGQGRG